MLTMTDLQSCVARLHKLNPPVDAVAEDFDGPPEWSSSDTGVCTATAAEDPWLARAADRGLRLLKHAADRLDRIVGERARRAATPEQRDQAQTRQEVLNRAIVRLRECPVAALRAPCGEAVARLLAGDDIAAVDAALVAAARGACDVEQLETAARQEFIAMRHRSSADGFERLVQQQVDRLVRDRAQLPDLLSLANVLDDEWRLAGALR